MMKIIIIVAFFISQKADSSGKIYDYAACLYPEGYIDGKHLYVFDKEDIDEVIYMGYTNEVEAEFQIKLNGIQY